MKVFANLGFRSANGVFSTTAPKVQTKEEKKISNIAKRPASRVRADRKPSPCVVTVYHST